VIFKSHAHKLLEIKQLQNSICGRLSRRRLHRRPSVGWMPIWR